MGKLTNKQLSRLLAWQFDIPMNQAKQMTHILLCWLGQRKCINNISCDSNMWPDNSEVINNLRKVAERRINK